MPNTTCVRHFYKAQGTGQKAQGTRHKVQGIRHQAQGIRHKVQNIKYKLRDLEEKGMKETSVIVIKSKSFAIRIIKLYQFLNNEKMNMLFQSKS